MQAKLWGEEAEEYMLASSPGNGGWDFNVQIPLGRDG